MQSVKCMNRIRHCFFTLCLDLYCPSFGLFPFMMQVAACSRCNSREGQKTIEEANMKLLKSPKFSYLFLLTLMFIVTR